MEVESTISLLHHSNQGFTHEQKGAFANSSQYFTGGFYIDPEGRRIELMSRWRLSRHVGKVAMSKITGQSRPMPSPFYESVSLTVDDERHQTGTICFWDLSYRGGHTLIDGRMIIEDIEAKYYPHSGIRNSPNPFTRHDYFTAMPWMPGNTNLADYPPEKAHAREQKFIQLLRDGSQIGWQTFWN